ncbi:MAG: prepilin-type N-terminal cleavage/methylation domain-containing protein [bacterium]|nr:prepilin-type N-terminal cleavage/methylation domain-containing protein [bacterium]
MGKVMRMAVPFRRTILTRVPGQRRTRRHGRRFLRVAGFTLLEATVALAIFAAGGMALYGLFNSNLVGLGKAADVSRREPVVLAAVEHLSSINIREQPAGQLAIGGFDIAWSSTLAEPLRQGQSIAGSLGAFEVGLYDVDIELSRNGLVDRTYRVRLAGYSRVRGSDAITGGGG